MLALTVSKILIVSIAVIIIGLVLLQDRSSGAGGLFGSGGENFYQKRRGMEKIFFTLTAILIVAFVALLIWNLALQV